MRECASSRSPSPVSPVRARPRGGSGITGGTTGVGIAARRRGAPRRRVRGVRHHPSDGPDAFAVEGAFGGEGAAAHALGVACEHARRPGERLAVARPGRGPEPRDGPRRDVGKYRRRGGSWQYQAVGASGATVEIAVLAG
jgi:hypothetical protein